MAVNRVLYAIMLGGALASFIISDSAVALFLLVCLAVFPLVSFVMLLIAARSVWFDCEMHESCMRGGSLGITMRVRVTPRFLVGVVKLIADIENTTFHKVETKLFMFKDLSSAPHTYDYVGEDSGRIVVKFRQVRLIDIFGIYSINVKCSKFAESTVSPVLHDGVHVQLGGNVLNSLGGELSLPRRGDDVSETYDVRDYAPGDALNAVHWKLSGKFDTLKSKEFGSTDDNRLLVLVDLSRVKGEITATDEQLNSVLDVAVSVSASLMRSGYMHNVGWVDNGVFSKVEVVDVNTFTSMVSKLMSIKVVDGNADQLFFLSRSAEGSAFTKIIFVTQCVETNEVRGYTSDITVITVGDEVGELDRVGIKVINVPRDGIDSTLASCVL